MAFITSDSVLPASGAMQLSLQASIFLLEVSQGGPTMEHQTAWLCNVYVELCSVPLIEHHLLYGGDYSGGTLLTLAHAGGGYCS